MIATGRLAALLGVAALLGTFAGPSWSQEIVYVRGLELPHVEDVIGYADAVVADRHTGEVFVCDSRKNRIVIFDADGWFEHEIPGGSVFSAPRDLAVDADGYLVVAANHQRRGALLELDFDGRLLREIRVTGGPQTAIAPRFASLALSESGARLYALDVSNNLLWIVTRDGRVLSTFDVAADLPRDEETDLILGKVDVYGDTILLAFPMLGEIRLLDLDGGVRHRVGLSGTSACKLAFPVAAALDGAGKVVVVDQQRMILTRWNPDGNRCLGEYYGPGTGHGYFYYPLDVSLGRSGRIYVSQGYRGLIQAYDGLPPRDPVPMTVDAGAPLGEPTARDDVEASAAGAADTVRAWARARAERRAEDFLAFYAPEFVPPSGENRRTWEASLREESRRAEWVEVELTGLEARSIVDDVARVTFIEVFRSNLDHRRSRTTLILGRRDGVWRILEERGAEAP